MSKVSNLDRALSEQLASLDGVQAEMVKSDMKTWKWNRDRIHAIQEILDIDKNHEGEPFTSKERTELINERHKLIGENTSLYSHINRALKGTVTSEDELDAFLSKK